MSIIVGEHGGVPAVAAARDILAGRYIDAGGSNAGSITSSLSITANVAYLVHVLVPSQLTISGLGCATATAGSATLRLALYAAHATTRLPDTLIEQTATFTQASGTMTVALPGGDRVLDPDNYWLAVVSDTTMNVYGQPNLGPRNPYGIASLTTATAGLARIQILSVTPGGGFPSSVGNGGFGDGLVNNWPRLGMLVV